MTEEMFFCVDAGATRSRGCLYNARAEVVAYAEDGPANASYDLDQAMRSVSGLWLKLAASAKLDPSQTQTLVLAIGGAGLFVPRARAGFLDRAEAFGRVLVMSDGYAALIGAGDGRPCALMTIGTGVAGHRLFDDGTSIQRDGWGWIVGDRGGGCWLGTRGVRHFMEVRDGISPPSDLSRAVMDCVGGEVGLADGALSGLTAHRLASFAPIVLETADRGCEVAGAIVERAIDYLAKLASVLDHSGVPLYLSGGLSRALEPRLKARIGRSAEVIEGAPLRGCFLVARGSAPVERAVFD
jgi:glucosamine kinase